MPSCCAVSMAWTFGVWSFFYAVVLRRQHGMDVRSVVFLLRPEAAGPGTSGRVRFASEGDTPEFLLDFRCKVIRVWEQPVESLLSGSLALLPLAPLARVEHDEVPGIIARMEARLEQESPPGQRNELWAATFLLMGLRYEGALIEQLLRGVQGMEESVTYQMLISRGRQQGLAEGKAEGKTEEAKNLLLRIGEKRFGKPTHAIKSTLNAATLEQLETMADKLLQAETWQELLA